MLWWSCLLYTSQAEPALQKALAQLKAGREFPPPRETLYDRLMSGPVNPVFYRFFVKADAFRATDACIGCGRCVELCPLNNVCLLYTSSTDMAARSTQRKSANC